MSTRHIVITGDAAAELRDAATALRRSDVSVSVAEGIEQPALVPVTAFIIAAHFTPGMEWDTWWEHDAHNRLAFQAVLPWLASSSNGMLLGFTDTTDRSERAEIRAGMTSLISRFHVQAATERGIDFAMNGLEVSPGFDQALLTRRLVEHSQRRGLLATESVIRHEDLARLTIAQATTADVI